MGLIDNKNYSPADDAPSSFRIDDRKLFGASPTIESPTARNAGSNVYSMPESTSSATIAPQETDNSAKDQIVGEVIGAAAGATSSIVAGNLQRKELRRAKAEAQAITERERSIQLEQQAQINKYTRDSIGIQRQELKIQEYRNKFKMKHDILLGELERVDKSQEGIMGAASKLGALFQQNQGVAELVVSQWSKRRK